MKSLIITLLVALPVINAWAINTTNDEVYTLTNSSMVNLYVLANDEPTAGSSFDNSTLIALSQPNHGILQTVGGNPDGTKSSGSFRYRPHPGFSGIDYFEYQICDDLGNCGVASVTIHVMVNTTIAINDDHIIMRGEVATGNVTINDQDLQNHSVQMVQMWQPGNPLSPGVDVKDLNGNSAGTIDFSSGGYYEFTPRPNYVGVVKINYEICDNYHDVACDNGVLTIRVLGDLNQIIVQDDEAISYRTPTCGSLLSNDLMPGASTKQSVTVNFLDGDGNPITTGATLNRNSLATGQINYTHDGNFCFAPDPQFAGTVEIPYQVCVGGKNHCENGRLTIKVMENYGTDQAPFAGDDAAATTPNTAVHASWMQNDYDGDAHVAAEQIRLTGSNNPNGSSNYIYINNPGSGVLIKSDVTEQGGDIEFFDDGTFTYSPSANFEGSDRYHYTICDAIGRTQCHSANIQLLVAPKSSDAPTKNSFATQKGISESVNITALQATPNPAGKEVLLTGFGSDELISIYNIQGELVFHQIVADGMLQLNLDGWNTGMYVAKGSGESSVRFIVQ